MNFATSIFYIYDLETLPNCFLFSGSYLGRDEVYTFEISTRKNQRTELLAHLNFLANQKVFMVGFNNLNFDYPILHDLLHQPYTFGFQRASALAQKIIGEQRFGAIDRSSGVRLRDRLIDQIDLLKINHFDNPQKATSLKALQFAMRSESVEDLPYPFDHLLTDNQMDEMISYNIHDITETKKFAQICLPLIKIRMDLLADGVLQGDVLNWSDVKLGAEYLVKKIGRTKCYSGSKAKQTPRSVVEFNRIVLPKISFRTQHFEAVRQWFLGQRVYVGHPDAGKIGLEVELAGLPFHFGLGGVHASVSKRVFVSTETHIIKDIDVSGMYVAVAIANGFAPEHLGSDFTTAYRQLQRDRSLHAKGTTLNKVLKLAGNGVYGQSNNPYSPFYDPQYTYSVTANGQLQLLQLVELLSLVPGVEIIQANTDGITAYLPREVEPFFNLWCTEWESMTGLKLEHVEYSHMWIRDVNNYIARYTDGKVKRKGAYGYPVTLDDYEGFWNKDYSNMSAQKGVEQVLIHGWDARDVLRMMTDPFDFMLRYKTPAGAKLYLGDRELPKTVRYYVSKAGQPMKKVSKPKGEIGAWKRRNGISDGQYLKILNEIPQGAWDERIHTKNKSKYEIVETAIESGRLIKECNHISKFNWADVDYDYYAEEINKLRIGV